MRFAMGFGASALVLISASAIGDLGYWEVDVAAGGFEYRAVFSSGVEMMVGFGNVLIEERPSTEM